MKFDWQLMLATSICVGMGMLIHYSISPTNIDMHFLYVCIGAGLGLLGAKLDFHILKGFSKHLYGVAVVLLIITLALAAVTRGSRRWLDFGFFQFQPSELVKMIEIFVLANWLSQINLNKPKRLIQTLFIIVLPVALILLQPDLGTALILLFISGVMLFVANLNWKYIAAFMGIIVILSPLLWTSLKPYQKDRVHTFLNPGADPLGKGYNSIQSQIAIGSGQIVGRGLGHGTQSKLRFLPESHTDFVFASLAEELGLMGAMIVLLSFFWLISRLLYLSQKVGSEYYRLLLIGITSMFLAQIVINMGMNMGVLPVTGITLPFVSAGGTSIVVSLFAIGIANGAIKKTKNTSGIEINGKDK